MSKEGDRRLTTGEGEDSQPSKKPKTQSGRRVKTGCLTCRARKVKCDEGSDPCMKCQAMLLACEWPAGRVVPSPSDPTQISPIQRPPACSACRTSRCKCSQDRPACERCVRVGVACEYPDLRARNGLTASAAARAQERRASGSRRPGCRSSSAEGSSIRQTSLPQAAGISPSQPPYNPQEPHHPYPTSLQPIHPASHPARPLDFDLPIPPEIRHHIDAYFTYVQPYSTNALFHRSSLIADFAAGRVHPLVILSICTITERYFHPESPHPQGSPRAEAWLHQAMSALIASPEKSLENVVVALLLARHCMHSAIHVYSWTLVAMANRQAIGIGLHREDLDWGVHRGVGYAKEYEDEEGHEMENERRRRIWWACYTLDRMMAQGMPEFTLCQTNRIRVALPGRDEVWDRDGRCYGTKIVPKIQEVELDTTAADFEDVGVMGHFARLVGVRYAIVSSARTLQEGENILQPWEPHSSISLSIAKLAHIQSTLDPSYVLTPTTIHSLRRTDRLGPIVMLHLWLEMFHLEMFRIAVPGYAESLPARVAEQAPEGWLEDMGSRALERGRNIMRILVFIEQETAAGGWAENMDSKLSMLIYASIRIQLELGRDLMPVEELRSGFEVMLRCMERIGVFYAIAKPLLRETRRMIRSYGVEIDGPDDDDGTGSPPHPWFKRLKKIEAERLAEQQRATQQMPTQDTPYPLQALYADPVLGALFDMPDWMGGDLGIPLDYSFSPQGSSTSLAGLGAQ